MKKLILEAWGEDFTSLADAVEHAVSMLRLKVPSENTSWEDNSHVDFDVKEYPSNQFKEGYHDEN